MIITNSSIGMDSARKYTSVSREAFTYQRNVTTLSAEDFMKSLNSAYGEARKNDEIKEKESKKDADTLSDNSEDSLEYLKGKFSEVSTSKVLKTSKTEDELKSSIRYMLLNFLLMLIFGKKGLDSEDIISNVFSDDTLAEGGLMAGVSFSKVTENVTLERHGVEFEEMTFNARGIVNTADGRQIDFGIDLTMSDSFEKYAKETGICETLEVRLCDPLIINLDGNPADISDQKFMFDLDLDGEEDSISMLGKGSGFLALDLNEDGKINDGSELFGAKSGDGFKDLAGYDSDGNGWIDEADEVFDKLRIMCFDDNGEQVLYKLKDKNVGAIYLASADTQFSVRSHENSTAADTDAINSTSSINTRTKINTNAESDVTNRENNINAQDSFESYENTISSQTGTGKRKNNINAQVRKTGIFLYESGTVGSLQHVDMAM